MSKTKRIFLSVFSITLLLVLFELILFSISLIKSNPAESFSSNDRVILAYGESTTQMGGENSWPSQLQKKLDSENPRANFKVINRGGVGISTITILKNIEKDLKSLKPEIVITMMGINEENLSKEYELIKENHNIPFLGKLRSYRLLAWAWYRLKVWTSLRFFESDELLNGLWEDAEFEIVIDYLKSRVVDESCESKEYELKLIKRYIELKELEKAFLLLEKESSCIKNITLKNYIHSTALIYKYSENNTIEKIYDNAFKRPPHFLGKTKLIDESIDLQIDYYKKILGSLRRNGLDWKFFKRGLYADLEESDLLVLLGILNLDKSNLKKARIYFHESLEKIKFKKIEGWIDHPGFVYLLLSDIEFILKGERYERYYEKSLESKLVQEIIESRKKFSEDNIIKTSFALAPLLKAHKLLESIKSPKNSIDLRADILNVQSEVHFLLGNKEMALKYLNELKSLLVPRVNLILIPRILSLAGKKEQALIELKSLFKIRGIDKEPLYREEIFIQNSLNPKSDSNTQAKNNLKKIDRFRSDDKGLLNYRKANKIILKSGSTHFVMQYPLRSIDRLRESLHGNTETVFVENNENFKKLLNEKGYEYLFIDRFASDFGHCTKEGNELIAENVKNHIKMKLNLKN